MNEAAFSDGVGSDVHANALHECQQTTAFTCVDCAAVSALSYFQDVLPAELWDQSEKTMAYLLGTVAPAPGDAVDATDGTTAADLLHGLMALLSGTPVLAALVPEVSIAMAYAGAVAIAIIPARRHAVCAFGLGLSGPTGSVRVHDPDPAQPATANRDLAWMRDNFDGLCVTLTRLPAGVLAPVWPPPRAAYPAGIIRKTNGKGG